MMDTQDEWTYPVRSIAEDDKSLILVSESRGKVLIEGIEHLDPGLVKIRGVSCDEDQRMPTGCRGDLAVE